MRLKTHLGSLVPLGILYVLSQSSLLADPGMEERKRFLTEAPPAWDRLFDAYNDVEYTTDHAETLAAVQEGNQSVPERQRAYRIHQGRSRTKQTAFENYQTSIADTHPLSVRAMNRHYWFEIHESDRTKKYALFRLLQQPGWQDSLSNSSFEDDDWRLGLVDLCYVYGWKDFPLPLLMKSPYFKLVNVRSVATSKPLVEVTWMYQPTGPTTTEVQPPRRWVCLLDPAAFWTVVRWNIDDNPIRREVVLTYQEMSGGIPFPAVIERKEWIANESTPNLFRTTFSPPSPLTSSVSLSKLSTYGLPEPGSISFPWWVWPLLAGLATMTIRMAYLRSRTRVN